MLNATQPPRRMRFSFESRCRLVSLVLAGQSPQAAAAACGASRATGYRLWRRYQEGGWGALRDRPPVPKHQPRRLSRELEQRILAAREYAKAGPLIVAGQLDLPASTVWKVLRRYGVSRLRRPARGPVVRYERERPGELLHVDIKKLGRFWTVGKRIHGDRLARSRRAGWQYLHLAIDDHSRLAYAELLPSESPSDCVAFLRRALSGTASVASASNVSSATTATATAHTPGRPPAPSTASPAATPVPDDPRPTARPKRSSRPCFASGPTDSPTRRAATAPERCPATSAGTTNTDRTARSAAGRRSAASHRSVGPTTSSPPGRLHVPSRHRELGRQSATRITDCC
jgi:transposase